MIQVTSGSQLKITVLKVIYPAQNGIQKHSLFSYQSIARYNTHPTESVICLNELKAFYNNK